MTTQLAFHDTQFNVSIINNQIWLTSKELAQALKYASTKSVTDIYNKNTDEFTAGMSQVVESTTSGNYRKKVRIFSLRGAHLIAMFARTEIAKEFRKWVLDILDKEVGNIQPVITPIQPESKIYTITLTEKELNHLCWLWKVADNMRKGAEAMHPMSLHETRRRLRLPEMWIQATGG